MELKINNGRILCVVILTVVTLSVSSTSEERKSVQILHSEDSNVESGKLGARFELSCFVDSGHEYIWQKVVATDCEKKEEWVNMTDYCKGTRKIGSKVGCVVEEEEDGENQSKALKLIFSKLRRSDLGEYSCGVSLIGSERGLKNDANDYVRVDQVVEVFHEFEAGLNSSVANAGKDATFTCELVRGSENVTGTDWTYHVIWQIQNRWREPINLPPTKYAHHESATETSLTIRDVTPEDAGWYTCALWNGKKFPIFTPERVEASFEFQVRVREGSSWLIPVITIGAEVLIIFVFMVLVETTKWFPDGDNSSDEEDPDAKPKGKKGKKY